MNEAHFSFWLCPVHGLRLRRLRPTGDWFTARADRDPIWPERFRFARVLTCVVAVIAPAPGCASAPGSMGQVVVVGPCRRSSVSN